MVQHAQFAVRWAIVEYAARLDVKMRAGLHTGECEMFDGKVGGTATLVGVCVANEANPGEVLVSSTVKDLVAGSGITFQDRGCRSFPEAGEWQLFAIEKVR
jgi:class 3 adenylate cyclase